MNTIISQTSFIITVAIVIRMLIRMFVRSFKYAFVEKIDTKVRKLRLHSMDNLIFYLNIFCLSQMNSFTRRHLAHLMSI